MKYRNLGRTGVKVSPLCLGCLMFGGRTDPGNSYAMIDRAIDAGINFLDTANSYGRGRSEEVTGEALKRNRQRDRMVLATKVHFGMDDDDPNMEGNSRRHIVEQCEASLRRLQTDRIDLYQIHRPQSDIPIDETLRALDDLIRAGKVRYIGSSTFAAWQVMESLMVARELGLHRFVCEQPPYNILDRRIERELIPMARTYGIGIIPWSPLASGVLTGKYRKGEPPPKDSRLAAAKAATSLSERLTDQVLTAAEALSEIARIRGVTPSQYALSWLMNQPGVTSPIIGPRTMAQLDDNLQAMDVDLSEEDRQRVDEIVAPGTHVSEYYRADWGPHHFR